MIQYRSSAFGFGLLLRLHGSAAAKSLFPALFSTAVYLLLYYSMGVDLDQAQQPDWRVAAHPYPIASLVAAFTFLLVFRANFSYNRYWEAAGAVHQMQSKWMDVGIEMGAFHMQCSQYDSIKPPSFGKHPELKSIVRERERHNRMTLSEMEEKMEDEQPGRKTRVCKLLGLKQKKKKSRPVNMPTSGALSINASDRSSGQQQRQIPVPSPRCHPSFANDPSTGSLASMRRLKSVSRLDGGIVDSNPSLFLQELCHLVSLLSAVALSTLRNDIENAESPLIEYVPGEPWPPVDPDDLHREVRERYDERSRILTVTQYLTGHTRTRKHRTLYNAARPFRVLGGVSDAECQLLQSARGPLAKVALCSMWLQEFISREYLNGSTGNVAPPIISRLFQYTSDGMVGYNQARKIAYIPFPFPHAQITSLFVFVVCLVLPILNLCWGHYVWFSSILNFLTVWCFAGLHEVARELENPFFNNPNDIPLATFQAQFNEALVTMYAGYHPDAFWTVPSSRQQPSISEKVPPPMSSSKSTESVPNLATVTESASESESESESGSETGGGDETNGIKTIPLSIKQENEML